MRQAAEFVKDICQGQMLARAFEAPAGVRHRDRGAAAGKTDRKTGKEVEARLGIERSWVLITGKLLNLKISGTAKNAASAGS